MVCVPDSGSDETDSSPSLQLHTLKEFEQVSGTSERSLPPSYLILLPIFHPYPAVGSLQWQYQSSVLKCIAMYLQILTDLGLPCCISNGRVHTGK